MIDEREDITPVEIRKRHVPRSDYAYEDRTTEDRRSVFRSYNIIWFIVGFIVALLGFRFVFELLGANPANEFVNFIYTLSYPFAAPFRTIFGEPTVGFSTFDFSILVGIVVYLLVGYGLVQLLKIVYPLSSRGIHHRSSTV